MATVLAVQVPRRSSRSISGQSTRTRKVPTRLGIADDRDVLLARHRARRSNRAGRLLVRLQRRMGADLGDFVTEGRDQGSVVFPEADVKFFLDWAREAAEQNIAPAEEERAVFDKYSAGAIKFWEELYRSVK